MSLACFLHPQIYMIPLPLLMGVIKKTIKTIQYSQSIGLKTELRFVPQGRGKAKKDLALSKEETLELINLIGVAGKKIRLRIGSPYSILFCNQNPKCMAGVDRLIISPDLSITPCDAFKRVRSIDIVDTDEYSSLDRWTLKECWSKSPYLNAVRSYIETALKKPCSACEWVKHAFPDVQHKNTLHIGNCTKLPILYV